MKNLLALSFAIFAAGAFVAVGARAEETESADDTILFKTIDMQFHEKGSTFGESRQPSFRVHAATAEANNSMQHWSLEDADAVILRSSEKELFLKAARCFVDRENEVAIMSDGVHATAGTLSIDLIDLHWDDSSGIAHSDKASEATDGTNRINGSAIEIFPREDRVEMFKGTGTIYMAAAEPSPEGAGAEPKPANTSLYEYLDVAYEGTAEFNLDSAEFGGIHDGVVLTLVGRDPKDNLTIRARDVDFEYSEEGGSSPSIILLKGKVELEHASFAGHADEVSVNFESGDVEFRGNAELSGDIFDAAKSNLIKYNLNTKDVVLGPGGGTVRRVKLFDDPPVDAAADPAEPRA